MEDPKTYTITIAGVEYPLFFSSAVAEYIMEHYRGLDEFVDAMKENSPAKQLRIMLDVVRELIKSGVMLERFKGHEVPQLPDNGMLPYLVDIHDLPTISNAIMQALSRGAARTVEIAEDPKAKNMEATQGS